jgi:hypothetical protein
MTEAPLIKVCGSRHEGSCVPQIWFGRRGEVMVLLMDAAGSWGDGAAAARWFRDRLDQAAASWDDLSLDDLAVALLRIRRDLPPEMADEELGWDFCIAALLVTEDVVHVTGLGSFSAVLVDGDGTKVLMTPVTLADRLVQEGAMTEVQARQFPHGEIVMNPPFGPGEGVLPAPQAFPVRPRNRILVGDRRIVTAITKDPELRGLSDAVRIRDRVEQHGGISLATAVFEIR